MKLNSQQQLAVESIEGPVMVVAGPGTGKTQIIAERIARILTVTDTPPDGILALTFTESGAKAMRQRLLETIGVTAYYVNISTFHSFCSAVIQEFPDHFIISQDLQPLSELERVEIFHQIIDSHQFTLIKPVNQPFYYTQSLIKAIQDLKREAFTPKDFKTVLTDQKQQLLAIKDSLSKTKLLQAQKDYQKQLELYRVYKLYQKKLASAGRYDFEDMINLVVNGFRSDKNLLSTYQERFLYFLVDEYQDTNSAQNQVIDMLASFWGDQANVFVVGDSNQSIFRFQGASLENVIGFSKTYPKAKIISLDHCYRSTQTILDASSDLIKKNHFKIQTLFNQADIRLISQTKQTNIPLHLIKLPSETIEAYWIAHSVRKFIKQGIDPREIAVLFRHNSDAALLSDAFTKLHLPIDIEGGANILNDPVINKLLTLLRVINTSTSNLEDIDLFTLFHYQFFSFNPLDILKLARLASQQKSSMLDLIISGRLNSLDLKNPQPFIHFLDNLTHWQQLDTRLTFSEFFETVIKQSGFLDWVMIQANSLELLNRLNSLFIEIKTLNQADHRLNLNSFLSSLDLMHLNHLKIIEKDLDIKSNAVTLTTAHKAKGKEWRYVYIYQLIDKKWGNNQTRELIKLPQGILKNTDLSQKEKNEDERRLFYVALTRAKQKIFLSYSERSQAQGYTKEVFPSMFLKELPQKLIKPISLPSLTRSAPKLIQTILSPSHPSVQPQTNHQEKLYCQKLIQDFKLSPTALNTYLTCPYLFKLNNLIRVPRAKQPYLSFGTAVHRALELFYRRFIQKGQLPGKDYLLNQFELALKKEILTESDYKIRLKKGKAILSDYFNYHQENFVKPLFTEKYFGSGQSKTFLGDIPLSGKIDRIDPCSDGSGNTVKVIDYKTGQPKTRNQILGKTKDSQGDYYRQLVFYKLLAQLDQSFKAPVAQAQIDFIEPDSKGSFKSETFAIEDNDIKQLKTIIRDVFKKIRRLNFPRTTDFTHCSRCQFIHHCWPDGLPVSSNP